MATHVHGVGYHRPDDRGRCTHTWTAFGCLVQCDSPDIAGSGLCLRDWIAAQLGVDRDTAQQLITEHTTQTTGATT